MDLCIIDLSQAMPKQSFKYGLQIGEAFAE